MKTLTPASANRPADVLPANAPAESKPHVVAFESKEFFGVGTLHIDSSALPVKRALLAKKFTPPIQANGEAWTWGVDLAELAQDGKTVLRIVNRVVFKTMGERDTVFKNWEKLEMTNAATGAKMDKGTSSTPAVNARKLSTGEQDLRDARLKVLRETYPDTFKAMDAIAQAQPEARPEAVEAILRAYAVDLVRLHKPANLGDISPFKSPPDDMSFILEIAKAYKAKSPLDPVEVEIAARWYGLTSSWQFLRYWLVF